MPPKRTPIGRGVQAAEPGYGKSVLSGLTSAENRSVVTAIGMFAVSWSWFLYLGFQSRLLHSPVFGFVPLGRLYAKANSDDIVFFFVGRCGVSA